MPVTPFHFGPGALIKGLAPSWFCWSSFALANALIDLEPVMLFLLTGDPAHPWLHTLPGALLVAGIAATLGRAPCEWALRQWNRWLSPAQARWLGVDPAISPAQAWIGALLGTLSHLALDAVMHADVRPAVAAGGHQSLAGGDFPRGAPSRLCRCRRSGAAVLARASLAPPCRGW